jgi:hypothetical protein
MMHSVVSGGVQYPFQRSQCTDDPSMDPELVQEVDVLMREELGWWYNESKR